MEFKIKTIKRRKSQKIRRKEESRFKRVKIRGRKRWVKAVSATPSTATAAAVTSESS